jgi:hypothetical protein
MCHNRRHHRTTGPPRDPVVRDVRRDPDLRASDADREEVVSRLREHGAAGRLDVEELEDRVGAAYAATTHRDLAPLEADLPGLPRAAGAAAAHRHVHRHGAPAHEPRAFVFVSLLLIAIWALTGAGYFWPVWVILWWGVALAIKLPLRTRARSGLGTRVG